MFWRCSRSATTEPSICAAVGMSFVLNADSGADGGFRRRGPRAPPEHAELRRWLRVLGSRSPERAIPDGVRRACARARDGEGLRRDREHARACLELPEEHRELLFLVFWVVVVL